MLAMESLLLAAVLSAAPSEPVLLEFSSVHCGACRAMAPVLADLRNAGYPIQKINVDERPDLAQKYGVSQLPSYVAVVGGQERDRVVGQSTAVGLAEMFRQAVFAAEREPAQFRGQSPDKPAGIISTALDTIGRRLDQPPTTSPTTSPTSSSTDWRPVALAASVRLQVEDAGGVSYGTGTIIDTHGDEALVLTCGHLFRDTQGQGAVTVDLFVDSQTRSVPGQLIGYDAETRDVALVAIRPGVSVSAVRVAAPGHPIAIGTRIFSVGCDEGRAPTVRNSQVSAVDRYVGPSNYEIMGQPVDGRSGGGLFTEDGLLIGLCNAADPSENRGIYAGLAVVHWQLDQIGQSRIYLTQMESSEPPPTSVPNSGQSTEPQRAGLGVPQPTIPITPVSNSAGSIPAAASSELICILRSPDGLHSRIVVLDRPSQTLVNQIYDESRVNHLAESAPDVEMPIVRAQSGQ